VHATNTAMLAVVNPGRPDRPGGADQARALTWEHVDLEAGTVSVWRSVRAHGDTKTNRSRRTLKLPEIAVEALRGQRERRARERAEQQTRAPSPAPRHKLRRTRGERRRLR
jgi:integrase